MGAQPAVTAAATAATAAAAATAATADQGKEEGEEEEEEVEEGVEEEGVGAEGVGSGPSKAPAPLLSAAELAVVVQESLVKRVLPSLHRLLVGVQAHTRPACTQAAGGCTQ